MSASIAHLQFSVYTLSNVCFIHFISPDRPWWQVYGRQCLFPCFLNFWTPWLCGRLFKKWCFSHCTRILFISVDMLIIKALMQFTALKICLCMNFSTLVLKLITWTFSHRLFIIFHLCEFTDVRWDLTGRKGFSTLSIFIGIFPYVCSLMHD